MQSSACTSQDSLPWAAETTFYQDISHSSRFQKLRIPQSWLYYRTSIEDFHSTQSLTYPTSCAAILPTPDSFYTYTHSLCACPVCQHPLEKPYTLPCGYTICITCAPSIFMPCRSPDCDQVHNIIPFINVSLQQIQTTLGQLNTEDIGCLDRVRKLLETSFECAICCNTMEEPTTTSCGHTFCRHCITQSQRHHPVCPICRAKITTIARPTRILERWISVLFSDPQMVKTVSPGHLPVLIGSMAYPQMTCSLHFSEGNMTQWKSLSDYENFPSFAMCVSRQMPNNPSPQNGEQQSTESLFCHYGTMVELKSSQTFVDGRSMVEGRGCFRFRIRDYSTTLQQCHVGAIEIIQDVDSTEENLLEQNDMAQARDQYELQGNSFSSIEERPSKRIHSRRTLLFKPSFEGFPMKSTLSCPSSLTPSSYQQSLSPSVSYTTYGSFFNRKSWGHQGFTGRQNIRSSYGLYSKKPMTEHEREMLTLERRCMTTESLIDDLSTFVALLYQEQSQYPSDPLSRWLRLIGHPPVGRGPERDNLIYTWWVARMMPIHEKEKLRLLPMTTLRERVLTLMCWSDQF
ncbi:hypothetical protein BDF14DRAFT_1326908 [Spinellus fusiger]|nr:hypothetical protein BDF14DRAFT_1326908 [Spinellus fusiger]